PTPPVPDEPNYPEHPFGVEGSALPHVQQGRAAMEDGHPADAVAHADEALRVDPYDVRALDLRWRALEQLGAISPAIDAVRTQRQIQDRSWLRLAERRLSGWLVATDPRWLPAAPPFTSSSEGPLLAIGDILPTELRREVLLVPTELDTVPSHGYSSLPLDVAASDLSWFAVREARGRAPRMVVAALRHDDLRPALAALAASRSGGAPLSLVMVPGGGRLPESSEASQRVETQYLRLVDAADVVVEDVHELALYLDAQRIG
ncbi:MAG: hypothetical protein R3320_00945, partial [Nitriliruptorales bacterium]|nr:hypothetical protein [Nitriliruptorales bacterium]